MDNLLCMDIMNDFYRTIKSNIKNRMSMSSAVVLFTRAKPLIQYCRGPALP